MSKFLDEVLNKYETLVLNTIMVCCALVVVADVVWWRG